MTFCGKMHECSFWANTSDVDNKNETTQDQQNTLETESDLEEESNQNETEQTSPIDEPSQDLQDSEDDSDEDEDCRPVWGGSSGGCGVQQDVRWNKKTYISKLIGVWSTANTSISITYVNHLRFQITTENKSWYFDVYNLDDNTFELVNIYTLEKYYCSYKLGYKPDNKKTFIYACDINKDTTIQIPSQDPYIKEDVSVDNYAVYY